MSVHSIIKVAWHACGLGRRMGAVQAHCWPWRRWQQAVLGRTVVMVYVRGLSGSRAAAPAWQRQPWMAAPLHVTSFASSSNVAWLYLFYISTPVFNTGSTAKCNTCTFLQHYIGHGYCSQEYNLIKLLYLLSSSFLKGSSSCKKDRAM